MSTTHKIVIGAVVVVAAAWLLGAFASLGISSPLSS